MVNYNYFTDATLVNKLAELLERPLDPTQCVVAKTASANNAPESTREAVLQISIPTEDGGMAPKEIRYDRLPLSNLADMNLFRHYFPESGTVHSVLPYIYRATGILFTTDDLEDLPVTPGESLSTFTVSLVAKPTSKFWNGSYDLTVQRKVLLPNTLPHGTFMGSI